MKVGFIGLGRMGTAMANRILGGGHDIADLVAAGAKLAGSAAEAARFGGVVITT
jgi:3-hydroxyisobutyrate dehydrogenase-like beta-hydroxyacid dehydrogenase